MNSRTRPLFLAAMATALLFGFLHLFIPGTNFERLHIFLFNLCCGGTIILIYTGNKSALTPLTAAFFVISLAYAVAAFLKFYIAAVIIAVVLHIIVESVRVKHFSFFPSDFFRREVPVSEKFHHASVLCLSLGLVISAFVIVNNEYLKIITAKKFQLDVFFLGFSFPVSLITMSVMFGKMKEAGGKLTGVLKTMGFWTVNLGVIIFFVFILLETAIAEAIISSLLFAVVIMIFFLYRAYGSREQPKNFLTSGMAFLISTAVTGIVYIFLYYFPVIPGPPGGNPVLKIHALVSLYGWNLSGLIVIIRKDDFPIRLHSGREILFHWLIVVLMAPFAYYNRAMSILTVAAYGAFLGIVFFTQGKEGVQ